LELDTLKDKVMIEIEITPKMRRIAAKKSKGMGELKGSITKGIGNQVGFLGECLVSYFFRLHFKNTYDYDFILPNGKTVDVKTKTTTVEPKDYYDCSVAKWNTKQKCDYYIFARINKKLDKGWLLGYYPKTDYFKDSIEMNKGDIDPSNNFVVKSDCYNMQINKLHDVDKLLVDSA
jgi:hypothetical protein